MQLKQVTQMKITRNNYFLYAMWVGALAATVALAQSDSAADDERAKAEALAKATLNPVASLISVPLQNNFDWGSGPKDDGFQYKLNVQPVIPISLSEDWNVISRTILPYVYQEDVIGTSRQSGLADTVQSLFFSPVKPTKGGWIWGAGPVLQLPTATDDLLGEEKWGAGPTGVALRQQGPWTYGMLFNHVWSFAGESSRAEVNRTFLQPFVSYTTKTFTSFGLNTESNYDWRQSQWLVPINVTVQQLLKVGKQPIALQIGARYYAEGPSGAPEWGLRFQVAFLFPK
ncbi:MAG TPA: transporter [Candidatus Paceibacterota bacterium]|nr:transporter [Candidatus Paceibacterota bacterium]